MGDVGTNRDPLTRMRPRPETHASRLLVQPRGPQEPPREPHALNGLGFPNPDVAEDDYRLRDCLDRAMRRPRPCGTGSIGRRVVGLDPAVSDQLRGSAVSRDVALLM